MSVYFPTNIDILLYFSCISMNRTVFVIVLVVDEHLFLCRSDHIERPAETREHLGVSGVGSRLHALLLRVSVWGYMMSTEALRGHACWSFSRFRGILTWNTFLMILIQQNKKSWALLSISREINLNGKLIQDHKKTRKKK